jgi:hypothetical protein
MNKILIFIFICIFYPYEFWTQNNIHSEIVKYDSVFIMSGIDGISLLDMGDVVKKLFKNKRPPTPLLSNNSLNNLKDTLKDKVKKVNFAIFPAVGYALQTSTTAIIGMNISFYNGKKENTNPSNININPLMSLKYKQYLLNVLSTIWTNKNQYNFVGDWRLYKYPTYTYGLGGNTQLKDADLINYSYLRFYQTVLKKISTSNFYAGLGYNMDYHFKIYEIGKGIDFPAYNGNATQSISSGISTTLIYNTIKNINSPRNANYLGITYRRNEKKIGSNNNWQSIYLEAKKFIRFPAASENLLCFWNFNWFTFEGPPPYFDLPSTGWDANSNSGRGYIQSRLRGSNMIYLETEYRFSITKNRLLGGVLFLNCQSVTEQNSFQFLYFLPATGVGLRIKLNKISNANLAIDYGFGLNGSRGLFFNIGEVF